MDSLLGLLEATMTSGWVYLLIIGIAALDAFFPVVPGETAVITAAVFAAGGQPDLVLVIAAAAAGAVLGDHISYALGRASGGERRLRRLPRSSRRRAGAEWARSALEQRGGTILLTARYVPGGRTAVTLTMGALGYPRRPFFLFDLAAGITWGVYCGLLGYLGGRTFGHSPGRALLLGLGLAAGLALLMELTRRLLARYRSRAGTGG